MIHHQGVSVTLLPLAERFEGITGPTFQYLPEVLTHVVAVHARFALSASAGTRFLFLAADTADPNAVTTPEDPRAARWQAQSGALAASTGGDLIATTAAMAQPATLAPNPYLSIPLILPPEGLVIGSSTGSVQSGRVSEYGSLNSATYLRGQIVGAQANDSFSNVVIWSVPFIDFD